MKPALNTLLLQSRYRLVTFISTRPKLYYGVRHISGTLDHLCISRDTELVIEGYPRSANSTTAYGFLDRQSRPVKLAHHKHHAAQLLRAADWNIPAVMLIRRPREAVLSNLALRYEAQLRAGKPSNAKLTYEQVIDSWLGFYSSVELILDKLVVAPFEEVTQDISGMIQQVNARFGTKFQDRPSVQVREKPLGWHAMPTDLRMTIKEELDDGMAETLKRSARLRRKLERANELHRKILAHYENRR